MPAAAKVIAALPRRARSRLVTTSTSGHWQTSFAVASSITMTLAVAQARCAASARRRERRSRRTDAWRGRGRLHRRSRQLEAGRLAVAVVSGEASLVPLFVRRRRARRRLGAQLRRSPVFCLVRRARMRFGLQARAFQLSMVNSLGRARLTATRPSPSRQARPGGRLRKPTDRVRAIVRAAASRQARPAARRRAARWCRRWRSDRATVRTTTAAGDTSPTMSSGERSENQRAMAIVAARPDAHDVEEQPVQAERHGQRAEHSEGHDDEPRRSASPSDWRAGRAGASAGNARRHRSPVAPPATIEVTARPAAGERASCGRPAGQASGLPAAGWIGRRDAVRPGRIGADQRGGRGK